MPLINIFTSKKDITNSEEFLQQISRKLSSLTGKPEKYVMALLQTNVPMTFSAGLEPCCYVEIKSIGAIDSSRMSEEFCKLISEKLEIPSERVYLSFEDIPPRLWGWDGRTFG